MKIRIMAMGLAVWPVVAWAAQSVGRVLAAKSGDGHTMRFTKMSAERTGVCTENRFADPQMWWDRYLEFTVGAIGTGVAIGDYDNDGRPDLFVVSKTAQGRLFRNLGAWRFEEVTEAAGMLAESSWVADGLTWAKGLLGLTEEAKAVAGWQNGAAWADVNNDGWLDLMIC
ncbi:MAG: VCBS repeat-containing protein [Candidatus Synoicihabitans palmerolidicus]|nr:VCBS repeat-containing protein [Candidatus Synoicihabitans palmerolidicus]